ncbi:hypothetical protein [Kingella kingae]|nr:hypothetical protein [Kingella kingae]
MRTWQRAMTAIDDSIHTQTRTRLNPHSSARLKWRVCVGVA